MSALFNPISSKINRMVSQLMNHTEKSNMSQKHAAMLYAGGKPLTIGYNHDRMTSAKKFILSFHAEVHAIYKYIDQSNLGFLKNYINDTEQGMAFRKQKNPSDL
jgi:hypothetical protein